jgi:hypothetical protein
MDTAIQKIIASLIHAKDYSNEIHKIIDADFLPHATALLRKIVTTKLDKQPVTVNLYNEEFSNRKDKYLVVDSAYHKQGYQTIANLIDQDLNLDMRLNVEFRGVGINLNLNESLVALNILAVKYAQIHRDTRDTAGKRIERYLMLTLCHLFNVPEEYYEYTGLTSTQSEAKFYLLRGSKRYACEVNLMGNAKPEGKLISYDRETKVFIADKLAKGHKQTFADLGIRWVELRAPNGYRKFLTVLQNLGIPCQDFVGDVDARLEMIFKSLFADRDSETMPLDL